MPLVQGYAQYQYKKAGKTLNIMVNLNYMFNFMLLCKNYMVILVNFVFIEL